MNEIKAENIKTISVKYSREIKAGIFALLAIILLILGINFLKGSSFFGGDRTFSAYFANSGGVVAADQVVVNGVEVGKIMEVRLTGSKDSLRKVQIKFSIQDDEFQIPKDSRITIGAIELLSKGMTIYPGYSSNFYQPSDKIQGEVLVDIFHQVKLYMDPINTKLQKLMASVDNVVTSFSAFWDTTATSSIAQSLEEVKVAIHKFGLVAGSVEDLVETEKQRIQNIFTNVESITNNLKLSNEKISHIIGNVDKITDDMATANLKNVIGDAQKAIQQFTSVLNDVNAGKGSLGKLAKDEKLYNELVKSNKTLQDLVNDLELHPERYLHFSVFGRKNKGILLKPSQEKKLVNMLDSIPD